MDEKGVRIILRMESRILQSGNTGSNGMNCTDLWRREVQDRIEGEVRKVIPRLETLSVEVSNENTEVDEQTVTLIFDVLIEIRSLVESHNIYRYIEGPFDTQVEKEEFTQFLRSTGCSEFANVGSVDVVVPKTEKETSTKDEDDSSSAGLIAGLALAILAILLLGATFVYLRVRNKREREAELQEMPLFTGKTSNENGYDYASEIGVDTNYDVSTLGDPIPPGATRNSAESSTLGSQSLDYDYQKAYADAQSTTNSLVTAGTGSHNDPSLSKNVLLLPDDDTLNTAEDQFEVVAPAGLLGLILESNLEDGRPTVNNIKPTSVLANVVKVGDRLLSVDDQDVSAMRASDVSHLISSKKDQQSRILCFSRPKKQGSVLDEVSEFD